jgi:transposase
VHRYNAEGIAGLCDRPKPGRTPKPSEGQMASLKAIVLAGPDPAADQIGRWRVVDLCRYVEERWDVSYSETGMLRLLWSLDLSHRKTRPRHPQSDQKAQQAFKRGLCCLPERDCCGASRGPAVRDLEPGRARVGQKGRTGYVWCQRGHTPRGRRDIGYQSAWMIGAVCPARDTSSLSDWSLADREMGRRFALRQPVKGACIYRHPAVVDG